MRFFTQTFRLRTGGLSVVRKASVNDLSVKKKRACGVRKKKKRTCENTQFFLRTLTKILRTKYFYGHPDCSFYGLPVRFTDTKTDSLRTKNGAPLPPY